MAGSKLIVVLGHSNCGAVRGACDHVEMGNLTEVLSKLQPAVYEERTFTSPEERNSRNIQFAENVSAINVRRSVKAIISRSYILEQMVENNEIAIIGGMHNLETGAVEFYDDTFLASREDVLGKAKAVAR